MQITGVTIHAVELPLKEGSYSWGTQSYPSFDSVFGATIP